MNLDEFIKKYDGKGIDADGAYGNQCVDTFRLWCRENGIPEYPTGTGYADGYWTQRFQNGSAKWFDFIDSIGQVKRGDVVFFAYGSKDYPLSHVCIYEKDNDNGASVFFGQNQPYPFHNHAELSWNGFSGAFRLKHKVIDLGNSDITIGEQTYHVYRQKPGQKPIVISAGLNKVAPITQMDVNALIMAQVAGANYFGMADGSNTTYGDISAPLSGVVQSLPNQKTTLFYDLETGVYGDCEGVNINTSHNVFSPALVFHDDTYEYAEMVGYKDGKTKGSPLIHNKSNYSGVIRFKDGTYAVLLAKEKETPLSIWNNIKTYEGVESLSVLDGGGSAQGIFGYTVYETGRSIPSTVAIVEPYDEDCESCKIDQTEPSDQEEPDGEGTTQELTDIKKLAEEVRQVKNDLAFLREVLKSWI